MHQKTIEEAKKHLFNGQLVIFPTETVYGIGANANNQKSIEQKIKSQSSKNNKCHKTGRRVIFLGSDRSVPLV